MVALSHERGNKTIGEERRAREAKEMQQIREHPLIQQTLSQFPGSEITGIRPIKPSPEEGDK